MHVAAAMFVKDGRVLACRRAPHKLAAGLWEFPGGKVELGEDTFSALEREIKEELGIECKALRTYDTSITQVGNQLIKLEAIVCFSDNLTNLTSTDHDEFRWLEIKDLFSVEWAKPDLPAVERLSTPIH